MSELLLELLSEEIPARMQARAAEDLKLMICEGLANAGLASGKAEAHVTPRRLALVIEGVPAKSADVSEERKGPRVGAPEQAIQGFLKGAGLASIADAEIVNDEKKGDFYVARLSRPGRKAADILAELVPDVVRRFAWPKSMRWGGGKLRWVRPLQSVLCLHGGKVVPIEIDGLTASATTHGHRFMGDGAITVTGFADYRAKLKAAKVMLAAGERAEVIRHEALKLAEQHGYELVEDEGLLKENAGLVEWPHVLMGKFDPAFLAVPAEILTTAMKAHQKCFSLRDPARETLVNRFLLVTNLKADDGGKAIIAGNEKVIRARLADAKFFFDQDLKRPMDEMWASLRSITFHEKLGTQYERVERIAALAEAIAPMVGADSVECRRAAQLAKADLVSGVVGEFPELQGLMGRIYAEAVGTKREIARAVEEHYWPRGAGDQVPAAVVSIAVALADKLDTLVGFWAIDEKPTGSKDPFALRRAALGVVRIVLENELRVPLSGVIYEAQKALRSQGHWRPLPEVGSPDDQLKAVWRRHLGLGEFFADRLKVHLREQGARHDLIDAVFALGGQDDLLLIVRRVEALAAFLATDDGATLLAGVKRAQNILKIEEKKDKRSYDGAVDGRLLAETAEKALAAAIGAATAAAQKAAADAGRPADRRLDDAQVRLQGRRAGVP